MKLVVFSNAPIVKKDTIPFLYAPYEKEMQLWAKHAHSIQFCCPIWRDDRNLLIAPVSFEIQPTIELKEFDITTFWNAFKAIPKVIRNCSIIYKAMKHADHIHLRCPGNIGLLACLVQILFPTIPKTAKYAGNWDPNAKQPITYKIQKWILNNTLLTKNMQVLVYGVWPNQSKNSKPFFTATYKNQDGLPLLPKELKGTIAFVFVGTLVKGKNPLYAVQLVAQLFQKGYDVVLRIYGDGEQRSLLEQYILKHKLERIIVLEGNQNQEILKEAYQNSHFVVLPSQSEGWPKAIAEGMFWGCVPVATAVSCVPFMLDYGNRGVLLEMNLEIDIRQLQTVLGDESGFQMRSKKGSDWSRTYTLDAFESEIKKLLQS